MFFTRHWVSRQNNSEQQKAVCCEITFMLSHIYTDFKGDACPSKGVCCPTFSNLQMCHVCNNHIKGKASAPSTLRMKDYWFVFKKKSMLSEWSVNYLWSCKSETKKPCSNSCSCFTIAEVSLITLQKPHHNISNTNEGICLLAKEKFDLGFKIPVHRKLLVKCIWF